MSGGRDEELGQQIEKRGLAGAIGTDQGVNLAPLHLQVDVADRDKSLEFLGQVSRFEYAIVHAQQRGALTGCPPPTLFFSGESDTAARQAPGQAL
jgi:hypothetical protein